jgi:branched-chain amino acid transport system substrate-binding protein
MTSRRPVVLLLAAATALLLSACTGQADGARPLPSNAPSAVPLAALVAGDGSLRLATVLDQSGAAASVSEAQVAGAQLAVREINEQGGVGGSSVLLVHRTTAADATALLADIAVRGIDVVLWGPGPEVPEAIADGLAPTATVVVPLAEPAATPDEAFSARLRSADPGLGSLEGGAEAYDATVLVALAAIAAANDSGTAIAGSMQSVLHGSFPCATWGECVAALAGGTTISYTGVTGTGGAIVAAASNGAPSSAP